MAWRYKLSNLFPEGKSFRVQYTKDGIVKTTNIKFGHGVTYETQDEVLIESLKRLTGRYPNLASNKEWLDSLDVAYDIVPCQACGGRVLKLQVNYFELEEI